MPGPYSMTRPCSNCPFLREGGIRLRLGRVRQIAGMMLSRNGGEFPCHKTLKAVDDDQDGEEHVVTEKSRHCAGALIFAEKNGTATQMMRISERLRLYDPSKLEGQDDVFDDMDEMLASAVDAPGRRKPVARKAARR